MGLEKFERIIVRTKLSHRVGKGIDDGIRFSRLIVHISGAETELRRAVFLAPADSHPKFALAAALAALRKLPEAIKLTREAIAIDPLRYGAHFNLAAYFAATGHLDEAEASLQTALALQPQAVAIFQNLALIEVARGNGEAALAYARRKSADNERAYAIAMVEQIRDDRGAADSALKALIDGYADEMAFQIVTVYAFRHDADNMFGWLNRALAARDPGMTELLINPFLRKYHDDPRFAVLCTALGLPILLRRTSRQCRRPRLYFTPLSFPEPQRQASL